MTKPVDFGKLLHGIVHDMAAFRQVATRRGRKASAQAALALAVRVIAFLHGLLTGGDLTEIKPAASDVGTCLT